LLLRKVNCTHSLVVRMCYVSNCKTDFLNISPSDWSLGYFYPPFVLKLIAL